MNRTQLEQLKKQTPSLVWQLRMLDDEALAKISLQDIASGSAAPEVAERFKLFCERLNIAKPPLLLVVDEAVMQQITGMPTGKPLAFYHTLENFIMINEATYGLFATDTPKGNYVLAHELGHAQGNPSRRTFLRLGGSAMAGLLAGKGTIEAADHLTDTIGLTQGASQRHIPREWTELLNLGVSMWSFKLVSGMAHNALVRKEEFRADDGAAIAIQNTHAFHLGIAQFVIEHAEEFAGAAAVADVRRKISQGIDVLFEGLPLSEEEKRSAITLLTADVLTAGHMRQISALDILSGNLYPSSLERYHRVRPMNVVGRQ